jgi:L-lactate dehydrogenase
MMLSYKYRAYPNKVVEAKAIASIDAARYVYNYALEQMDLKQLLGQHLGVDSRSVHAFIIGEHGDSELAVWSSANVSGIDLKDFCAIQCKCQAETLHNLYEEVRNSAYEVIKKKGATYYAISEAVLRITESIVRDEHSVLPVSCFVDNHYCVSDVCIGVPSIVGKNGIEAVLDIPLNEEEGKMLSASVEGLKNILAQIDI